MVTVCRAFKIILSLARRPATTLGEKAEKPWCYDRLLDSCRRAWDEHDKTCGSFPDLWLGYYGGVSCPSDLTSCDGCGAMFYNEGVVCINCDVPGADADEYRCECCRRGYPSLHVNG